MITPLDRLPLPVQAPREFECTPEDFVAAYYTIKSVYGTRPRLSKTGRLIAGEYCYGDTGNVAKVLFGVHPPEMSSGCPTPQWQIEEWRSAHGAVQDCLHNQRRKVNAIFKRILLLENEE